jgi:hypothetical protein
VEDKFSKQVENTKFGAIWVNIFEIIVNEICFSWLCRSITTFVERAQVNSYPALMNLLPLEHFFALHAKASKGLHITG